jgi:hypothetical protein
VRRFEESKMEKAPVPDPRTVWEASTVMEEQIQSLADRGLLRPKSQAGWRPAAGEDFPMEGTGKTIVFLTHIERGFSVLAGDFLHGLLHFYRIELVHLALNSITIISTFIDLCEAYLGIAPHFHLWRHFFKLKKTGKGVVVSNVGFMLRRNMKLEYINLTLPDNTTGWKEGWFYLDNPAPAGRPRAAQGGGADWHHGGHQLLPLPHPASPGSGPLDLRVLGQSDPTRVAQRKLSKAEMMPMRRTSSAGGSATGSAPRQWGYTVPQTRYVFDLDMHPSKVCEGLLLLPYI